MTTEEEEKVLSEFAQKLIENIVETPPEFDRLISENLFDLI